MTDHRRPRLLDVCCKQGGASAGYHTAGFDVYGIDREDQPRYPHTFHRMDLRDLHPSTLRLDFDALHFSPPCWAHSDLRHRTGRDYEDFVTDCRRIGDESGLPYVIENVEGAPLLAPLTLCGTQFQGLRVIRHRLFESNIPLKTPERPCPGTRRHPLVYTRDKRKAHYGRLDEWSAFVSVNGGGNCTRAAAEHAMGIPPGWMTKDGLNQAIPPAYAQFVGRQLLAHLGAAAQEHTT